MAEILASQWEGTGILDSSIWDGELGSAGGLAVATDQYLEDTHSLKYTGNSGSSNFLYVDIAESSTVALRFGFRVNAFNSEAASYFATIYNTSNGALCSILYNGVNSTIYGYNYPQSSMVGSAFTVTADTWYQIEIKFVQNTSISWKIWNAAGGALVHTEQTSSTSITNSSSDRILFGMISSPGGSNTVWWDSFIADNADYPGPYVSGGVSGNPWYYYIQQ